MLLSALKRGFGTVAKAARNEAFAKLQKSDIEYFKSVVGETGVITESMDKFNIDEMKKFRGQGTLALAPNSTQQLQQIMRYCNEKKLAVVPQSGNTGLVGGSVPVHDEIVLSLAKINKIHKFDEQTNILTADAGVVLEHANEYVKQHGCELPWDLGSKGSCMIGGNTATHAGGKYYVKYGPMRASILGMEVVLANGEILDLSSEVRKDNSGIDLKQLFIGSEGALGIITRLNMLCHSIEPLARSVLGRTLAAIEWMDSWAFKSVMDAFSEGSKRNILQNPFSKSNVVGKDFYVLIESTSGDEAAVLEEKFTEQLLAMPGLKDCVKAESQKQFVDLWQIRFLNDQITSIRELVGPSVTQQSQAQFKYDISLDIKKMNELTEELRRRSHLAQGDRGYVLGYGHIGDSNLHINIALSDKNDLERVNEKIEPYIFDTLKELRGSISAEHGLGQLKAAYLPYQKSLEQISVMWDLKKFFDPNGILNPYKVFPVI